MSRQFEFVSGQVVAERYQLLSLLGSGGMGTVWRARHLVLKTPVALKLLSASALADLPQLTERFMREAKAVSSLESPHLVKVLDYGVDSGVPYIAMELLEGESLAQRLRSVLRLSPAETSRVISQVASGLARAHEAGIVHRDVKPANIFLAKSGDDVVVRVLDFGIAKTRDPMASGLTLTETGAVLGTPHYMSPEQVQGARHIDPRSDLWSLAVIAFECLTGVLPFRGDSLGGLFIAICVDPPPLPSSFPGVPPGFDEWFQKAASRDPAKRFQSAGELADELARLCDAAEPLEAAPAPRPASRELSPEEVDTKLLPKALATSAPDPLTLLAVGVDGEPQLMQRLGDDYPGAMARKRELLRSVALRRGGMIAREALSSSFVVFNDARSALQAALDLQQLVAENEWPRDSVVRLRMALHTCQRQPTPTGLSPTDLRRAQALCSAGHGGQILVSESLQARLTSALPHGVSLFDLGQHEVEGSRSQHLFQAVAAGLGSDFAPLKTTRAAPHNLPLEVTEFVGRVEELRRLDALCSESRLVTLVGPGGTGKSRLAVRAAAELWHRFSDGTFFVPLAAVRDPSLVASTVAGVLGVVENGQRPALEALLEHLRQREMLLILDNFEQVLDAAPDLSRMLEAAPGLKLLVTSRVVLRLADERVFDVPPLSLPAPESAAHLEALRDNEAVGLFVSRASRVDPSFALSEGNARAVAEIVTRLDGLPLAIELAAARTRLFSPEQLARQLKDKQNTLHDGSGDVAQRHRALRDVVAWSHDLLGEEERALFRRLAVFVGGFAIESADRVTTGPPLVDVPAGLRSLVEKSLVRREIQNGVERLVMLECIREFAEEELEKTDEIPRLRRRHAQFFSDLAAETEPELKREGSVVARDRLSAEDGNLRAALDFYLGAGDANKGLGIAASIWRYWQSTGRLQEGRRWLAELLARPEVALSARARGLTAIAGLAYWQADYPTAMARYRDALAIYRELGDRLGIADTLFSLSTSSTWSGDIPTGERLAQEALTIFEDLGAREQVGMVKMAQGFACWMQRDLARARPLWEASIEIAREVGDNVEAAHKTLALASITFQEGELDEAVQSSVTAMNELFERRNIALTAMAIDWIASMVVARAPEAGARLAGAAAELRRYLGGGMKPEACGLPSVRSVAVEKLGEDYFKRAFDLGRRMDLGEAVEFARGILQRPLEPES